MNPATPARRALAALDANASLTPGGGGKRVEARGALGKSPQKGVRRERVVDGSGLRGVAQAAAAAAGLMGWSGGVEAPDAAMRGRKRSVDELGSEDGARKRVAEEKTSGKNLLAASGEDGDGSVALEEREAAEEQETGAEQDIYMDQYDSSTQPDAIDDLGSDATVVPERRPDGVPVLQTSRPDLADTVAAVDPVMEDARKKADALRLRLQMAMYKIHTNQTDLPLSQLQVRDPRALHTYPPRLLPAADISARRPSPPCPSTTGSVSVSVAASTSDALSPSPAPTRPPVCTPRSSAADATETASPPLPSSPPVVSARAQLPRQRTSSSAVSIASPAVAVASSGGGSALSVDVGVDVVPTGTVDGAADGDGVC